MKPEKQWRKYRNSQNCQRQIRRKGDKKILESITKSKFK
jgi:hypothetical protein